MDKYRGIYDRVGGYLRNMKLKTKLNVSYIILIIIPLLLMSYIYYLVSSNVIINHVESNAYKTIIDNNKVIDLKFKKIVESSDAITVDHDLFEILNSDQQNNNYQLIQFDKDINKIIYKFFPQNGEVYSVHLITSYYNFGNTRMYIPKEGFYESDLYKRAVEFGGKLCWIPTYNFANQFNEVNMESIDFDYKFLFSAVKLLNNIDITDNEYKTLRSDVERPILVINFKPEIFDHIIGKATLADQSNYYIISREGDIIYDSMTADIDLVNDISWINDIVGIKNGTIKKNINGKDMIICFSELQTTNWISMTITPVDIILKDLYNLRIVIFLIGIFLIVLSTASGTLISGRITKPINELLVAIKDMGQGKSVSKIDISGNDEIGNLVHKFNDMEANIKKLIEENYISKIRQKEATIMALNIQLNPHFLYNTLNIINWIAIENNQREISKLLIKLSSMLQYTVQNHNELVDFRDDLEWLQSYIYIMESRFEGKFTTYYDINPEIYPYKVPKLFMQPLVENAIIHGFKLTNSGGILKIKGWKNEDVIHFSVEDNGVGMNSQELTKAMEGDSKQIGIKNADNRIKLLYGQEYGVNIVSKRNEGTCATIAMPSSNKSI